MDPEQQGMNAGMAEDRLGSLNRDASLLTTFAIVFWALSVIVGVFLVVQKSHDYVGNTTHPFVVLGIGGILVSTLFAVTVYVFGEFVQAWARKNGASSDGEN